MGVKTAVLYFHIKGFVKQSYYSVNYGSLLEPPY